MSPGRGTGAVLEGFVDLLYETPDGLVVVDYKTDALADDAAIDAAADRYRPQLGAYVLALESALGMPVSRCVLLFLAGGRARQRELIDVTAAAAEARRLLAHAVSS